MSELFMECEEEELEPWQKQIPEVNLVDDDDDDEPIFIGELVNNPKSNKANSSSGKIHAGRQEMAPQVTKGSTQIMLSTSVPAPPTIATITPQPVIVNNQGFIVTQPQLSSTNIIASLGKPYPPGTSFTIVPAGQQQLLPRLAPAKVMPGVVHRPQVKQINNNVVTLSNVQSPAVYTATSNQLSNQSNCQPIQIFSVPVKAETKKDQSSAKRGLVVLQNDSLAKKAKVDLVEQTPVMDLVENGVFKWCPKCKVEFLHKELLKSHMMTCCVNLVESLFPSTPIKMTPNTTSKHIMLVSEFYYGRFEGDWQKQRHEHKTNTTFKCQSCLKVLKNNIRFMNHMKHHLELEKQSSESWDSHTTCQHCYRQYMTPFQLQCHIESAHSSCDSSTNCKICELAFESEQVLLEHMKDTHKPGEMPYVCQVCNYRSSFFMEVEAHFRVVHENTKDLLCPFCLKVLRSSHTYMQHYMKHQKKGIHRCGKCRLNFLTYKERVDHKINFHKTFKKPKALEGLPPGTKVTIRASLAGKVSTYNPNVGGLSSPPEAKHIKLPAKPKLDPQVLAKAKPTHTKRQQDRRKKKNMALKNLRINGGHYTCIECDTEVNDFFTHYPMVSNCGACKYQTSCKVSIGNHMIRFHSTISKDRFWRMGNPFRRNPNASDVKLSCFDCDFLVDASEGDQMTKHLTEKPNHACRVIQEQDAQKEDLPPAVLIQSSRVLFLITTDTKPLARSGNGAAGPLPEAASEQSSEAKREKDAKEMAAMESPPKALSLTQSPSSVSTAEKGAAEVDEPLGDGVSTKRVREQDGTAQEALSPAEHTTETTLTEAQPVANQETTQTEAQPVANQETTQTEAQPVANRETTQTEAQPLANQETTQIEAQPLANQETTQTEAQPLANQETTQTEAQPLANQETTQTEAQPLANQETTRTETQPLANEETTQTETQPLANEETTQTEAQPLANQEAPANPPNTLHDMAKKSAE